MKKNTANKNQTTKKNAKAAIKPALKSVETKRAVVPIHFIGQNSDRFYTIAEWCKRLHLKFNLAMLFLPDEMYRSQHGKYKVIIGRPIPYTVFDKSRSPMQWAQYVKEQVYKL